MAIVTALEVQKRNKERVNVYLDGEFAFGLTLIEAAKLRRGQTLTDAQIVDLRNDDEINKAYDHAVFFLGYRPRSTSEVRKNLVDKGYSDEAIEACLMKLTEQTYLDDESFARYWVSNRSEFKPRGARALRMELRQKGIADTIISTVLEDQDMHDDAYRAAQTKARRYRGKSQAEFKHKVGQFLARRGFDYRTSETILLQLIEELVADDPQFFVDEHSDEF
ncbi:MAG: RecX family transcriptional regulator [Phototrophicales bacterium]|nr:RecX family transcriptional regulator [Phototrophicales bacterium]